PGRDADLGLGDADAASGRALRDVHPPLPVSRRGRDRPAAPPGLPEPAPRRAGQGLMPLELLLAGVLMVSLNIYALGAGADFGGGVWDLLASGPRQRAQRNAIAHAIGPIWEANHVWLILVIVVLFVAFPVAFAALATALHIPLSVMLIGIVLRGSAFAFRTYGGDDDATQRRWGRIFAMASVVTPVMLGVCAGAVASGAIRVRDGRVVTDFVSAWLAPFPF